ncbi:hypothetical protein AVEN_235470-1 [Araneus ventricosus]|uniref:Uncharacterized protein n=1 Tax=Araneus ventricosus TaxID=182803 RepID=A0A4Y2A4S9_ARAVE|nr:hypothetical protein AVEN_235470-1 [Araneus ventricosus]
MRNLKFLLKDKRNYLVEEALQFAKYTCEEMGIPVVRRRTVWRKKIMPGEKAADEPLTLEQELKRSMLDLDGLPSYFKVSGVLIWIELHNSEPSTMVRRTRRHLSRKPMLETSTPHQSMDIYRVPIFKCTTLLGIVSPLHDAPILKPIRYHQTSAAGLLMK